MVRLPDVETLLVAGVMLSMVLVAAGCGGRAEDSKPRLPERAGAWQATTEPQHYDAETIFAYIDGHAEVYLAYGMQSCRSRRYAADGVDGEIVVDLFEMPSADDAFGVFTVDLDGEIVPVGHDGRYRYGWLSYWKGRYFVSVYAEEESEESRNGVFELGHAVAASMDVDAARPEILADLPERGLETSSTRFLRSEQILRTHLYLGEGEVAGLGPDSSAVLARYNREPWTAFLMLVDYADEQDARAGAGIFSRRFLKDGDDVTRDSAGRWYGSRHQGARLALVIGAGAEELALELLNEAVPGGD
jgi:hypothetical protein